MDALATFLSDEEILSSEQRQELILAGGRKPWTEATCRQRLEQAAADCLTQNSTTPMIELWKKCEEYCIGGVRKCLAADYSDRWTDIAYFEECWYQMERQYDERYQKWFVQFQTEVQNGAEPAGKRQEAKPVQQAQRPFQRASREQAKPARPVRR